MGSWRETKLEGLREAILDYMASDTDILFQDVDKSLVRRLRGQFPTVGFRHLEQELWRMLADGLLFVGFVDFVGTPSSWKWFLTDRGLSAARGTTYEPAKPDRFLSSLYADVPNLDPTIEFYVREALRCFKAQCYAASAVMTGVAAEAAFQGLGEAFCRWLPDEERVNFQKTFDNPRSTYNQKFTDFGKHLYPKKPDLPADLRDNLDLTLNGVAEYLRVGRNEAGHPNGQPITPGTSETLLSTLGLYLGRVDRLRCHFDQPRRGGKPSTQTKSVAPVRAKSRVVSP